jgi:hypothetical protein
MVATEAAAVVADDSALDAAVVAEAAEVAALVAELAAEEAEVAAEEAEVAALDAEAFTLASMEDNETHVPVLVSVSTTDPISRIRLFAT